METTDMFILLVSAKDKGKIKKPVVVGRLKKRVWCVKGCMEVKSRKEKVRLGECIWTVLRLSDAMRNSARTANW
jgi:hypothetical protein